MTFLKCFFLYVLCSFILLFFSTNCYSQFVISGRIEDSTSIDDFNDKLNVSVIEVKDSSIIYQGEILNNTNFSIEVSEMGNYYLAINSPYFTPASVNVFVDKKNVLLPVIFISSKYNVLNEVVIINRPSISIKGDTTKYNIDSFKNDAINNDLISLLSILPGLSIDNRGSLFYFSKPIDGIDIDGKQFNANNPIELIQSLKADDIKSVDVYKMSSNILVSDNAELSGEKMRLNIVLNEDAKKQFFGNVYGGVGSPNLFDSHINGNLFANNFKASGIFKVNNTGNIFGQFGAGNMLQNDLTNNDYGKVQKKEGEIRLESTSFLKSKGSFAFNYMPNIRKLSIASLSHDIIYLPGNKYNIMDKNDTSVTNSEIHNVGFSGSYRLDNKNMISIGAYYDSQKDNIGRGSKTDIFSDEGLYINTQESFNSNQILSTAKRFNLQYERRFSKNGRLFRSSISSAILQTISIDSLNVVSDFSRVNYSQSKHLYTNNYSNSLTLLYTQPIFNAAITSISYLLQQTNDKSLISTYELKGAEYEINDYLSSKFEQAFFMNHVDISVAIGKKRIRLNVASKFGITQNNKSDYSNDVKYKRVYFDFFPRANISYDFKNNANFSISYFGQSHQPSINQVQPNVNNSNPLNNIVGNPNLRQEFIHNIIFNYSLSNIGKSNYIYIGCNSSIVHNPILFAKEINEDGETINLYINGPTSSLINGSVSYISRAFKYINMSVGFNASYANSPVVVNEVLMKNHNYSVNPNFICSFQKTPSFSIRYKNNILFNFNTSFLNQEYTNFFQELYLYKRVASKVSFGGSVNLNLVKGISSTLASNQTVYCNAFFQYNITHGFMFQISAINLFNEKSTFSRSFKSNSFSESEANNRGRCMLISCSWNFANKIK